MIKDIDDREMPLLEHLLELRNRLVYSCIAIVAGFLICYFFSAHIFEFLVEPLAHIYEGQTGRRMIYTGLTEAFFTYVRVAFFAGAFITFPFVASQLWLFIAPGLYRREKQALLPFLAATPILFFIGGAFAYYVVFPLAWRFFVSFETHGGPGMLPIELEPRVAEYLDLVMKLIFAFGLAFELPVALTLLGTRGNPQRRCAGPKSPLRDRRRLHCRRDHHAARRRQPDGAGGSTAAALRDLDLPREAGREATARGRSGGRR